MALTDNGDELWIGTNGGLVKFDGVNWTVYDTSNSGLPDNKVSAIAIEENKVWIGTVDCGLAVYTESGIEENNFQTTTSMQLFQNHPNPFTTKTVIEFVGTRFIVSNNKRFDKSNPYPQLKIYDLAGRLVKTFNHLTNYHSPITTVVWNGEDNSGKKLPSGAYFYQLKIGNHTKTNKMYLIR